VTHGSGTGQDNDKARKMNISVECVDDIRTIGGAMGKNKTYVARVKGVYGIRGRTYLWSRLTWSVIFGVILAVGWLGSPAGLVAGLVVVALGAAITFWMWRRKPRVFRASAKGLRLGGARDNIWIPWELIREINIAPHANGALADVIVEPSAIFPAHALSPRAEYLVSLIPYASRFLTPPLLIPLAKPPRYRAPLWGTTAKEVAEGLRSVAPDSASISA
jgi:hypothetical protein